DQQRETGRMALGETVTAKALDLLEAAPGEIGIIAVRRHALQEPVLEGVDRAVAAEGPKRAAQTVGLAGGEPGAGDGYLHRLLLKQRNAEGPFEHALQFLRWVADTARIRAALQIG